MHAHRLGDVVQYQRLHRFIAVFQEAALVLDDRLWPSHLAQDWPAWQRAVDATATRLQTLTAHAYAQGAQAVEVVLCGQRSTRTCTLRESDRWRFWRNTPLPQLLAEPLA